MARGVPGGGKTDRSIRGKVIRLAVLTALLAVYPLGVVVLRYVSASGDAARPDVEISGTVQPSAAAGPMTGLDVRLEVRNAGPRPVVVEQVMLMLLDGQDPVASVAEDGPALRARAGGVPEIAPGDRAGLGPFRLEVPARYARRPVVASLKLSDPRSEDSRTVQQELAPPAAPGAPALPRPAAPGASAGPA